MVISDIKFNKWLF